MNVQFFAHLIDLAGTAICTVEGPQDVTALVHHLCATYGPALAGQLLNHDGQPLHDDLFVLVNGRHIRQLQGLATPLQNTDTIAFVPIVEAG
ncbi:MAG: MoaD/ThiS family protein [Clostridia bacterium]|nr:MoaD/ThiS family protein [Clostridia bacterium]NCC76377.1 MoaD/ThiS family protein [Clostridia bacterium]